MTVPINPRRAACEIALRFRSLIRSATIWHFIVSKQKPNISFQTRRDCQPGTPAMLNSITPASLFQLWNTTTPTISPDRVMVMVE